MQNGFRHIVRVGLTSQKELVDEGLYLRELALRQLAMAMARHDTPTHTVANAEGLPHLLGSLGRNKHRTVGQPLVVGIAQKQQSTRTYHCTKFVLVIRQTIDTVTVEILSLALLEPVVVGLVEVFFLPA